MKPYLSKSRSAAITMIEVVVVVGVIGLLVAIYLFRPTDTNVKPNGRSRAQTINCMNNLKEVGLAERIWEGDHGDKPPFAVSTANGGSMELAQTGDVVNTFLVMSNQLWTPKLLHCAADSHTTRAANFSTLSAQNISYFIGLNANEENFNGKLDRNQWPPDDFLSGDDNFKIGWWRAKSGLHVVPINASIAWTTDRHPSCGNILYVDGSAQQMTTSRLVDSFHYGGTTMAIP